VPNILIAMPSKKEKLPLSVTHPELAKEADGWDPGSVNAGNSKRLRWKCSLGHTWDTSCGNRTISKSGCPVCAGQRAWPGFNDLASTHPSLALEADGWNPTEFIAGTNKKLTWICNLGHRWTATGYSRVSGTGCPYCSNQKLLVGFNDLESRFPSVAAQANGWDPKEFTYGSVSKMNWTCSVGHNWRATINGRTGRDKTNCPICANKVVQAGFNDIQTTHPEIANEADGWDPSSVGKGSNKAVAWKCLMGHRWKASPTSRINKKSGCPFCSNQKILLGFNDLVTVNPELASQSLGWNPASKGAGSNSIVGWKCEIGHIWNASINSRVSGSGCPFCSGKKVLVGFNDLASTHPNLAIEALDWDPTKYSRGSDVRKKWRCASGHVWIRSISGRVSGTGCPSCATSGFDPYKESWLYFLSQPKWQMLQIGITNDIERRIREHKKNQWDVLEIRGPMDGHLTQQWETAILRMLKAKGADLSNEKIAGKFDGYSEAWSKSTFGVSSIKELMRLTEEFEEDE
jgi:hypothetical protein